jgi:predicted phage terminase large subunit-like protein
MNERSKLIIMTHHAKRREEKRRCEESYEQFVKSAWCVLEPDTNVIWNWHMTYLCTVIQRALERVSRKEKRVKHLLVNIPPSSAKSMLFTRMPNAWSWIKWPWMRFLSSSYAGDLSLEHSSDTRSIIRSDWYQSYWGDNFLLSEDQDSKSFFKTDRGGRRQTTSTGSKVTGRHAHIINIDDPISAEEAASPAAIERHIRYYKRTLSSRFIDPSIGMFWVIMQRLDTKDLTGYILENEKKRYYHICLPAEEMDWISPPHLRKHYVNGLFFPDKFNQQFLDDLKAADIYAYTGQYLQRPTPEEGGMFKRYNWKFWIPPGHSIDQYDPVIVRVGTEYRECEVVELPRTYTEEVCSWDFSFKDKESNDPVAGFALGQSGSDVYITDRRYGNMDYSHSAENMIDLKNKHPAAIGILVEDKALGTAIIQDYKAQVPGIIPVQAHKGDSPHSRAQVASRYHASKNLVLPHPQIHKWAMNVVDEFAIYKNKDDKNDQITAICQAVVFFKNFHPVFPSYSQSPKKIKLDWRNMENTVSLYISQWIEQETSILIAAYNTRTGILAILNDLVLTNMNPEIIKPILDKMIQYLTGGILNSTKRFEWFGSPNMFGSASNTGTYLRQNYQREGIFNSYARLGIDIQENRAWEEKGAITRMNSLIIGGKLVIDEKAQEVNRQFASWCYEGDKTASGYGLAMAACNIVSMLFESGAMDEKKELLPAYSQKREIITNKLNQEAVEGTMGFSNDYIPIVADNNSWMAF